MEIALTRYLYIKEDVLLSLIVSILEKNYDKALFWTSELYFSGLEEEVTQFIYSIYRELFYSLNPKLDKLLCVGLIRYDQGIHILATMLINLVSKARKYTLEHFMSHEKCPRLKPDAVKEKCIFIFADVVASQKYSTEMIEKDSRPLYKMLQHACKYEIDKNWTHVFDCIHKDFKPKDIQEKLKKNWMYYAHFTPIWKDRIEKYNGTIDYENKKIYFKSDEDLESFSELYEYDIDEQPLELYNKISHTLIPPKQDINDFYKKYQPNRKIIKIKLKRVNQVCSEGK